MRDDLIDQLPAELPDPDHDRPIPEDGTPAGVYDPTIRESRIAVVCAAYDRAIFATTTASCFRRSRSEVA